jgi:rhodanese-related sulfurtransferase
MAKTNQIGGVVSISAIILIVYFLYYYYYDNFESGGPLLRISVGEAKARRFGLIIDVRTPKERELLGYYPNSIPISPQRLQQQVPLDISSKNTWILVYSNGDSRAEMAAKVLYSMGYKNVRYINETYLSLMPGSS